MRGLAYGLVLEWPVCPAGVSPVELERPTFAGAGGGLLGNQFASSEPATQLETVFRCNSPDRKIETRDLPNLEDCVVADFVNARPEGAKRGSLVWFLNCHGFPGRGIAGADGGDGTQAAHDLDRQSLSSIMYQQYLLRGVLREAGSGDAVHAVGAVNEALRHHDLDEAAMWRPDWARPEHERGTVPPIPPVSTMPFKLTPRLGFSVEDRQPALQLGVNNLFDFMMMECAFVAAAGARVAECQHCGNLYLTGPMTGRRSTSVYCREACRKAASRKRDESDGSGDAL